MNFAPIDWILVVGYLALSLAVGTLGKRYIGNVAHFLVGGRKLGLCIGIVTLAATEIGTKVFWAVRLLVAGVSFALIALMVMIRGGKDLREMMRDLSRQQTENSG